jgi:DNA-binding PadR family transcriptional regulator
MTRKAKGAAVNRRTNDDVLLTAKGLSGQQCALLDAVARLEPCGLGDGYHRNGRAPSGTAGYYHAEDLAEGDRGRSAAASRSRALARLERRGLIRRHTFEGHKARSYHRFFTLTDAGLEAVNRLRARHGLKPLAVQHYQEKPPMTEEEFVARLEAGRKEFALHEAINAALGLDLDGLGELRRRIDARLAELSDG